MAGSWSSRRWETADAATASALAACVAAGALLKLVGGPTWAAVALAGAGVAGALLRLAFLALHARARGREEWRIRLVRDPLQMPSTDTEMIYALGVEQESDAALQLLGSDVRHAPYLARDVDTALRPALRRAAERDGVVLIVVTGRSKTGKSRTALEAAFALPGVSWLLVPQGRPTVLAELAGAPPRTLRGPAIVWLDDLELWTRPADQGLSPHVLDAFRAWRRPVILLGTAFGKGVDLAGSEGARFQEVFDEVLGRAQSFGLESRATAGELERGRATLGHAVTQRLEHEGLGEFMIAASRLVQRLDHDRACPAGQALARVAIDSRRAGVLGPIPGSWLRDLFGVQLAEPTTDELFAQALEWATQPLYATTALLSRADRSDGAYEPYDFAVEHVARGGAAIHPVVWDHVIEACPEHELSTVAHVAYLAGDVVRAERALQRGDRAGDAEAAFNLGVVLDERGADSEAEAAYRRASERGNRRAAVNLGLLLEDRGDEAGAEAAFRLADERGDPAAAAVLGALLTKRGDVAGAEAAFRRGDDRGNTIAAYNLGVVLYEQGRHREAESALRRADERGSAEGAYNLGIMLTERGMRRDAEQAFERAEGRGNVEAVVNLGLLLAERGDAAGAEAAFRRADARGDAAGAANLGALLLERGDVAAAEAALRRGDEGGDGAAAFNLALILRERGERAAAEAALRRAEQRGLVGASSDLGILLVQRDETDAAEQAFRRADAAGDGTGALNLGVLLWKRGDVRGAEAAFRRACERGETEAETHLRALLQEQAELR